MLSVHPSPFSLPPPSPKNSLLADSCGPRSTWRSSTIERASWWREGNRHPAGWGGVGGGGGEGYLACIINEASGWSLICDIKRPCPSLMFDTQGWRVRSGGGSWQSKEEYIDINLWVFAHFFFGGRLINLWGGVKHSFTNSHKNPNISSISKLEYFSWFFH